MDRYIATEQAYKNGYKKGYKDAINEFTEELKERMWQMCLDEDISMPYPFTFVDKVANKMLGEIEK